MSDADPGRAQMGNTVQRTGSWISFVAMCAPAKGPALLRAGKRDEQGFFFGQSGDFLPAGRKERNRSGAASLQTANASCHRKLPLALWRRSFNK
jgi:hypothetical protein